MLYATNRAGFAFVWEEGSDVVEVFHSNAAYPSIPLEAVRMDRPDAKLINQISEEYTTL